MGFHNNLNLRTPARIITLGLVSVFLAVALLAFVVSVILFGQIGRYIILFSTCLSILLGVFVRLFIHRRIYASPLRVFVAGPASLIKYLQELAAENTGRFLLHNAPPPDESFDIMVVSESNLTNASDAAQYLQIAGYGTPIFSVAAFVEAHFYRIPAQYVSAAWLFAIDLRRLHPFHHELKRFLDISLAGIGLVLSAPIVPVSYTHLTLPTTPYV